jgi:hypothetical protein
MVDEGIFYNSKLTLLDRITEYGEGMWMNGFITGLMTGVLTTTSALVISIIIHRRVN